MSLPARAENLCCLVEDTGRLVQERGIVLVMPDRV